MRHFLVVLTVVGVLSANGQENGTTKHEDPGYLSTGVAGIKQLISDGYMEKIPNPCMTAKWGPGLCTSYPSCATWAGDITGEEGECELEEGIKGVCCPETIPMEDEEAFRYPNGSSKVPRLERTDRSVILPMQVEEKDLAEACQIALVSELAVRSLEDHLYQLNITPRRGSASASHQELFKSPGEAYLIGRKAYVVAIATLELKRRYHLGAEEAGFGLNSIRTLNTILRDACPTKPQCNPAQRYSNIDGSCNNHYRPDWGKSNTALYRLSPAHYEDGVWQPRSRSATPGLSLPSPRYITTRAVKVQESSADLHSLSLLVMLWGQLIDHEMVKSPIFVGMTSRGMSKLECCTEDGQFVPHNLWHPSCFPIHIPHDDYVYGHYNKICMNFVRSTPAPRPDCDFGYVDQMNSVTAFIDGSSVYGASYETMENIRGPRGSMLYTVGNHPSHTLMPVDTEGDQECSELDKGKVCFKGGETRVNEHGHLTILHTILHREHNRISYELAMLNPHWSSDTIFYETRRIIAAILQHITYNEYLPVVMGRRMMYRYEINTLMTGYAKRYDHNVNPTISNEFSSAAFRMGHNLISAKLLFFHPDNHISEMMDLVDLFNNPMPIYNVEKFTEMLRGLINQPCKKADNEFDKTICNDLFKEDHLPFGMDLLALNIQRGRDHGLAPYNHYRELCGLKKAYTFEDLRDVMSYESIERLRRTYSNVNDIDLFMGGVLETPIHGSLLGATFTCIIGDQFYRTRKGDRFFYDEPDQVGSFTPYQLTEIRKTSLARLICDNSAIRRIQSLAFFTKTYRNREYDCNDYYHIPRLNLAPWRSLRPENYGAV